MNAKDLADFLSRPNRRQFLAEVTASALAMGGLSFKGIAPVKVSENKMKLTTWRVLHADVPNSNGNVYSRAVIEKAIDKFQRENKTKRNLFGELGMSGDSIIHLEKASHLIKDLKMDGDYMVANVEVLNIPSGNILKKLISKGCVAFKTKGFGSGEKDDKGVYHISKDYKLITVNAVSVEDAAKI